MAKSNSSFAKDRAYLRQQAALLRPLTSRLVAEVGIRVYQEMVLSTKVDSGQAAANWHMVPYKRKEPQEEAQRMMWGFGDTPPIPPVGWKAWSGVKNPEMHANDVIEAVLSFALNMKEGIAYGGYSGVSVYNPIAPGFSGFFPGDDSEYADNALGNAKAQEDQVEKKALQEAEMVVASMFPFVRAISK